MTTRPSGRFVWRALGVAVLAVTFGAAMPAAQATNTAGGGAGQVFVSIVPCRLLDTRGPDHIGPRSSPLGPGDTYNQAVTGSNGECVIPAQATGVALNVTTVNGSAASFLTIWPSDAPQPLASNLNWRANDGATPNKVDVKLGADGRINMFNAAGSVDVIGDIVGYYADHNHDDRYYTKAEVDAAVQAAVVQASHIVHHDSYGPMSIITFSGSPGTGVSNCTQTGGGLNIVPLTIPVGAKLISIEVDVIDGASSALYSLQLVKYTVNATGSTLSAVASAAAQGAGTGSAPRVHHTLAPAVPETIEAGESLNLEVNTTSGNAFCAATFNYETFD